MKNGGKKMRRRMEEERDSLLLFHSPSQFHSPFFILRLSEALLPRVSVFRALAASITKYIFTQRLLQICSDIQWGVMVVGHSGFRSLTSLDGWQWYVDVAKAKFKMILYNNQKMIR